MRPRHLRPSRPRGRALVVLLPLVLLLGACAEKAPQDTLEPEGPIAKKIDQLVDPVFLVAGVVFLVVELGAVYLMWRFRRRKDDDDSVLPTQTHGNFPLEIGWTIVPALLLVFVSVFTVATLLDVTDEPDGAMEVEVIGQQWWWAYEYDLDEDGEAEIVTANDLVIPAGEPVNLRITSRDVIHSFWVPKLNGKKDAVPGRVHPLTIEADAPGTYVGQCTEYCGLSHAYMRVRVIALPRAEFDAWVEDQEADADMPTEAVAEAGAEVFRTTCSSCHLARGINDDLNRGSADLISGAAPDLTHFATRGAFAGAIFDLYRDADGDGIVEHDEIGNDLNVPDLEAWLRDPPANKPMAADDRRGMPNFELSEQQIDQLVAFLATLD
jgi:cytochrome c oxidase subunit 2